MQIFDNDWKRLILFRLAPGERNIRNVVRNIGNSMREKCKIKHKFSGAKAYKVEQVRKYFVNPKIGNEVFG